MAQVSGQTVPAATTPEPWAYPCSVCGGEVVDWVCATCLDRERLDYIAGLRHMAQVLEDHPELAPSTPLSAYDYHATAEKFAAATSALLSSGPVEKSGDDKHLQVTRTFGPHSLIVFTSREAVCERRQVGTKTVEEVDPEAPKIKVERPVYEWECSPILAHHEATA